MSGLVEIIPHGAIREIRFVMSTARFIAIQCSERDDASEFEHVRELTSMRNCLSRPQIRIVDRNALITIHQLQQLIVSCLELIVVTHDGDVVSHPLAHLLMEHVLVFGPTLLDERVIYFLLLHQLLIVNT